MIWPEADRQVSAGGMRKRTFTENSSTCHQQPTADLPYQTVLPPGRPRGRLSRYSDYTKGFSPIYRRALEQKWDTLGPGRRAAPAGLLGFTNTRDERRGDNDDRIATWLLNHEARTPMLQQCQVHLRRSKRTTRPPLRKTECVHRVPADRDCMR